MDTARPTFIAPDTCIVRNTAARKGRTHAVAPGSDGRRGHLHYGRIILDAGDAPVQIRDRRARRPA